MIEFFAEHFSFMAGAYSHAYGIVNGMLIRLILPAEIMLIYFLIESVIPKTSNSLVSTVRSLVFVTTSLLINDVLFTNFYSYFDASKLSALVVVDLTPLTTSHNLPVRVAGWIVAAFAAAMIGNFFYYWLHRAQHRFPVLWRFHCVHHSITELSAVSSYHHFTEETLQYFATGIPIALLLKVDNGGAVPWIVLTVAGTQSYFIHSSMNVNIGWLRYIFGDNHFHRIHHSREERHYNKNFGTSTTLWDALFGTAHFPKKREWPATGLDDVPEPTRLRDFLMMPFRKNSRGVAAAPTRAQIT